MAADAQLAAPGTVAELSRTNASSMNTLRRETFIRSSTLAGATAGFMSSIITCPLDVAKTRLQNQSVGMEHYHGTIGTLRTIYMEEGIRGLYRGLSASLLGYLPNWAVYFTAYDHFKEFYADEFKFDSREDARIHIVSALSAGALSTFITNPLWVIKTRLMTQSTKTHYHYTGPLNAFATIVKQEGWRGLYRGLLPSLLGVSHITIQFPLYEQLKLVFLRYEQKKSGKQDVRLHSGYILLASAISKVLASVCTYPHEVLRTRLHNQTPDNYKYHGLINTGITIIREEGYRGLYKGMLTNLFRVTPAGAITFLTYELVMRYLNPIRPLVSDIS